MSSFLNIPSPEQGASRIILSKKQLNCLSNLTGSQLVTIVLVIPKRSIFSDKIPALNLLISLAIINPSSLNLLAT